MKLYLVQHGEACAKELDPERPLTAKGEKDMDRLAAFLGRAGIRVRRVIHSGKLRAAQTAARLAAAIAPGVAPETSDGIKPNDDCRSFAGLLESGNGDLLVVGHLPFMERLVSHLVTQGQGAAVVAYAPGSIVCLELADAANWQINWMLRPELFGN